MSVSTQSLSRKTVTVKDRIRNCVRNRDRVRVRVSVRVSLAFNE